MKKNCIRRLTQKSRKTSRHTFNRFLNGFKKEEITVTAPGSLNSAVAPESKLISLMLSIRIRISTKNKQLYYIRTMEKLNSQKMNVKLTYPVAGEKRYFFFEQLSLFSTNDCLD